MSVATQSSTTNRIDMANGQQALFAFQGCPVLTWRAKVLVNSFNTLSALSDCIHSTLISGGATGLMLKFGRITASTGNFGCGGRASPSDGVNPVYSNGVIHANMWYDLCAVIDIPRDIIHFYINGRWDSSKAHPFAGSAIAPDGTLGVERIGHRAVSTDANSGLNGLIEELAMWKGDIGPTAIAELASGVDPSAIDPENLTHYWPLRSIEDLRDVAPLSRNLSGGTVNCVGIVAGTLASGPSPPSVKSLRRMRVPHMLKVSAASFKAAWSGRQFVIGSGVY